MVFISLHAVTSLSILILLDEQKKKGHDIDGMHFIACYN